MTSRAAIKEGRMEMLINVKNRSLEERIEGGLQNIAIRLAERLDTDRVRLRAPVRQIPQSGVGYLAQGVLFRVQADKVFIANPPSPPLETSSASASPRDQGLCCEAFSLEGVSQSTFNSSPPDASFGVMMRFLEANEMRRLDDASKEE
ncbi:monoamine oxidase A [Fusarium mexicanum]|uniref:Monoamine oxidase A n=1 Tax=Fusarium mexicanum TaxID=751941 RepID=A0A8H5JPG2_9HYPO|nr:monoamine oxidase A [Fusarium mexicanum]